MNWAAEHELPEAQKVTHMHVHYEAPSKDPSEHCGNCKNFIKEPGELPRCRSVKSPIRAIDYCVRWDAKEAT